MKAAQSRNVILLALSQALGSSGSSMVVLAGGILGADIAPSPSLATLPISITVVGMAIATIPAAMLMRRIGRKKGYLSGALLGAFSALLAVFAIFQASFWMFCGAALLIGASTAFIQQYRFGAAESVSSEHSSQAVSFVLLGGIAAGFLGPEIARRSEHLLSLGAFSGSFLILAFLFAIVALLLSFLQEIVVPESSTHTLSRPLGAVIMQPNFLLAVFAGAVSFGVMSFIMTATPLEMHKMLGYSLSQTTVVIQSHLIAMYLPSLFTGFLLSRLGERRVMMVGVACLFACVGLGIVSQHLLMFWGALVLLGIGWNFLYVGSNGASDPQLPALGTVQGSSIQRFHNPGDPGVYLAFRRHRPVSSKLGYAPSAEPASAHGDADHHLDQSPTASLKQPVSLLIKPEACFRPFLMVMVK